MIQKDWLDLGHVNGDRVTIVAYPGTPQEFTRTIDLHRHGKPETYATADDVRLDRDYGCLVLDATRDADFQIHVSLPEILWPPESVP